MTSIHVLFAILLCIYYTVDSGNNTQLWSVNISASNQQHFEYFWNKCVGSGHGSLALRQDWQQQLKYVHDEIGFTQVRFHGILDDDVGPVNGNNDYSFVNIDKIYDYIISINMKPYVEISFMPEIFATNASCTTEHYKGIITPPKDWNTWYYFIKQWMQHLVDRYGISQISTWKFEVWYVNQKNKQKIQQKSVEFRFCFLSGTNQMWLIFMQSQTVNQQLSQIIWYCIIIQCQRLKVWINEYKLVDHQLVV